MPQMFGRLRELRAVFGHLLAPQKSESVIVALGLVAISALAVADETRGDYRPAWPIGPVQARKRATLLPPRQWIDAGHGGDADGYPIGYAYAPAIIRQGGKYHMFFCSLSSAHPKLGAWDAIRYTTSEDGIHWSAPVVVLEAAPVKHNPTTDRSACDPSVVRFDTRDGTGPQYYLFYTGNAINVGGTMYVARSKTIRGPYRKYTKRGTWELHPTDPKIIIGPSHALPESAMSIWYGAGEQSILVRGNELVSWYMDDTTQYSAAHVLKTMMATSTNGIDWKTVSTNLDDEQWIESVDVKFDPISNKYLMFDTPHKARRNALLERRYSADGRRWSAGDPVCAAGCFPPYGNSVGVSGDKYGHLLPETIVGFASPYLNISPQCNGTAACFLQSLDGIDIKGYAGGTLVKQRKASGAVVRGPANQVAAGGRRQLEMDK